MHQLGWVQSWSGDRIVALHHKGVMPQNMSDAKTRAAINTVFTLATAAAQAFQAKYNKSILTGKRPAIVWTPAAVLQWLVHTLIYIAVLGLCHGSLLDHHPLPLYLTYHYPSLDCSSNSKNPVCCRLLS